ncbi:unnamed protein product [Adineta ricciae]|uniref:Uncharacterized protein n=1 Tax=Adineta ricciae TaxID=249248 RepID=A0A815YXU8_ADIRI|nr:unnamed protein product [Adineta ricciae]
MSESIVIYTPSKPMDVRDFYTIETPPSSSTSKDSIDELCPTKTKYKLSTAKNNPILCSTSNLGLITISNSNKEDEFTSSLYEDMHTPLRRALGNTKLKTRQDVRRFRKFLKRYYDISSTTLVDIDPDTMRTYLIDYLTSIRTRKGLKYDPETLRSYYLSIQRFLKDSSYPYCLRNSPQFAQCRDLIIQMRKEKNQVKTNDISPCESKKKQILMRKFSSKLSKLPTPVNYNLKESANQLDDPIISSETMAPIESKHCLLLTKDLLPSSSLPLRKRQEMKYFLDFGSPNEYLLLPKLPASSTCSSRPSILSSDAYLLLVQFTLSSTTSHSSSQRSTKPFEQLLDQSPACGNLQRLMLTSLCHEWAGDIRLIHSNLRPELNSFLPHILVLNILSSKYSY